MEEDYKLYLERFAVCNGITKEEAEQHQIVKEYKLYLEEKQISTRD